MNTQDLAFISQFNTAVKLQYEAASKLLPVVRKHTNVVGSTDKFQKIGGVTANTKARNAALTFIDAAHSVVDVTLEDAVVPMLIDDLDKLKTNIDMQKEYSAIISKALGKKADNIIITAATANATTITTTAGGFTYAKATEILTFFNDNEVPEEDRILVLGSKQLAECLNIAQFTSSDYNTIQAVMNGGIGKALGMTWILSSRLPIATSVRSCFAFHKDALGVSIGQEPKTTIERNAERFATQIVGSLSMGAKIIDAEGVVEIPCTE